MHSKFKYEFHPDISLHTENLIAAVDANRQESTAKEILKRLNSQPGLILADEVGMGKTFVALAVGISSYLADPEKRPVVIMVPTGLRSKWVDDFLTFKGCIKSKEIFDQLSCGKADNAEEFLKHMDDPVSRRKAIVFIKYGAMSNGLSDPWVKIALIKRALKGRHNIPDVYTSLARYGAKLVGLKGKERNVGDEKEEFWNKIYTSPTSDWMKIINKFNFYKEPIDDDPVPALLDKAIEEIPTQNMNDLFYSIRDNLPRRDSSKLDDHLMKTRQTISSILQDLWQKLMQDMDVSSPLLILDEAHHLKNSGTNLAKSFYSPESVADAEAITKGNLVNVFDRILFLTATPFQLGHHELINILERFQAIEWSTLPSYQRNKFNTDIKNLQETLNKSQICGVSLDKAWGKLTHDEISNLPKKWWISPTSEEDTENIASAKKCYQNTFLTTQVTQETLRPWVIRHLRPREFNYQGKNVFRRQVLDGAGIVTDKSDNEGLAIESTERFPFLLAARAVASSPESRPVFAEGLASSYEAFLDTRKNRDKPHQDDETDVKINPENSLMKFYLDQIENSLDREEGFIKSPHPKIEKTVDKAIQLWERGEKVLIFCHYYQTGRALRHNISKRINRLILEKAATRLNCEPDIVKSKLTQLGKSIDGQKELIDSFVDELLLKKDSFKILVEHRISISKILKRMIRTPNFLARYYPLEKMVLGVESNKDLLQEALSIPDSSQMSFHDLIMNFLDFLSIRPGNIIKYLDALETIKTGSIFSSDEKESDFDQAEHNPHAKDESNAGVRLANGVVTPETRRQLMLAFNTPFIPEILIASSVMAEGVDLHLNCRYIIHHDLSWNPSTIEQRTGRVDRIGAKVENCGQSIQSYLPFLAATQDEKMFRVVMDRERWFKVVMGDKVKIDSAFETEKLAERVPFPNEAAETLMLNLEVTKKNKV